MKLTTKRIIYGTILIVVILLVLKYFKIYPFNDEYFQNEKKCYKTCIDYSTSPLNISSSLYEEQIVPAISEQIIPSPSEQIIPPPSEQKPTEIIPAAPMLTGNNLVVIPPPPPILEDKGLKVKQSQPDISPSTILKDTRQDLLESIRKGMKLKSAEIKEKEKEAETIKSSSTNPLLKQIQQGVQLRKTNLSNKQINSSTPIVSPSLQDQIFNKIKSMRESVKSDDEWNDEYFRYFYYY